MIPNLQNPENPLPYDPIKVPKTIRSALSAVRDKYGRPSQAARLCEIDEAF